MNSNLVIFKGISKKSGKVYYSFKLTTIIEGELLVSNGLLYQNVAMLLVQKGANFVDLTNINK